MRCGEWRRLAPAVSLVVLLAGCTPTLGLGDAKPRARLDDKGVGTAWALSKPVGAVFTDGVTVILAAGSGRIRIDRVEATADGGSVRFIGAMIAGPARGIGLIQQDDKFPPTSFPDLGHMAPASGFTFTVDKGWRRRGFELLLGYRVQKPGEAVRRTVRVVYTVDGEQYAVTSRAALGVCAPLSHDCDPLYQRLSADL